jgi:hypothetical protein
MFVHGRSPCPHHDGRCAYLGTEPDRCPVCHRTWLAIRSGADYEGTDAAHADRHAKDIAYRNRRAAQKALRRAQSRAKPSAAPT